MNEFDRPVKKTKVVDFVPEYNQDFDFKKVSDYDFLKSNSALIPVINLISMEKGSNQLFPDMGVKDFFMTIPYQEETEVEAILDKIEDGIKQYVTNEVSVTLDKNSSFVTGEIMVNVEVEGMNNPLTVDVNKSGLFKIHKASLYKK